MCERGHFGWQRGLPTHKHLQRVATALAAYVKTHMAASPEAVADIVSQFATKLAMDPTSLTPRSVEATLQHSPRTAAATIMRT